MRILLTNDDGINGKGLIVLAERLKKNVDIWILAPDSDRSGVSHAITMNKSLLLTSHGDQRFSCSGVPVDCVITALRSDLFGGHFDAVIAGINKGANMGTDILYSGTAAAARQSVLYGIPGIAVSLDSHDGTYSYNALADFVAENITGLINLCGEDIFVSVNALSASSYTGVEFSGLCKRDYRDTVSLSTDSNGIRYSTFKGGMIDTFETTGCDYSVVNNGKIAVSRIFAEPRDAGFPEKIQFKL